MSDRADRLMSEANRFFLQRAKSDLAHAREAFRLVVEDRTLDTKVTLGEVAADQRMLAILDIIAGYVESIK